MSRGGINVSWGIAFIITVLFFNIPASHAQVGQASVYLSPNQGTFSVGSTFDVSIFVNTAGLDINAVSLDVKFSEKFLQIVDPTAGNSFISVWVSQPTYSNTNGSINFQGGLPSPGINTTAGLVSTITFRATSPGEGTIEILPSTKVLANDGRGTNVVSSFGLGRYTLAIPAPEGPSIISSTHGDQNRWYRNNNPVFSWQVVSPVVTREITEEEEDDTSRVIEEALVIEYSWSFDQDAFGLPDNDIDGRETLTSYENVESGIWYFHVKAKVAGIWGETSHYPVRIDTNTPASFIPSIEPKTGEAAVRRLVTFTTTDQHSGIDHYEIKIESLTDPESTSAFFIEQASPWQAQILPRGEYRVIIRAFDRAGNHYDAVESFSIRPGFFSMLFYEGFSFWKLFIPWWVLLLLIIVILVILSILLRIYIRRHIDPSEKLSKHMADLRKQLHKEREKVKEEITEEKQVEDILHKELEHISTHGDEVEKSIDRNKPNEKK